MSYTGVDVAIDSFLNSNQWAFDVLTFFVGGLP